jgi:hypothetical protein
MAHLIIGQRQFPVELTPLQQNPGGISSFKAIVSCRNADMAFLQNHIQQLALNIFNDFEPLIDERVRCFMIPGDQAKYHIEIKGNYNEAIDFRAKFPEAAP